MKEVLLAVLIIALSGPPAAEADPGQHIHPAQAGSASEEVRFSGVPNAIAPDHLDLVWNESVERYLNYFSGPGKRSFQKWLDNSARALPLMQSILHEENLPGELVYVAMIESGFSPSAHSRAHAAGPWQLMPETARSYGLKSDIWRDERKDPVKSTRVAAMIFKDLYANLESWPLVLAAYNAGIGRVHRAMALAGADDFWDLKKTGHLKRESRNYVPKFMAAALIGKDPEQYGFRARLPVPSGRDQVIVAESTDLAVIASWTGSTYRTIRSLNPELNSRFTPPGDPVYIVNIPRNTGKLFQKRSAIITRSFNANGNTDRLVSQLMRSVPGTVILHAGACRLTRPEHPHSYRPLASAPLNAFSIPLMSSGEQRRPDPVLAQCDRQ